MEIVWDERKRQSNVAKHRLDFAVLTTEFFLTARVAEARAGRLLAIGEINGRGRISPLGFARTVHHINATSQRKGMEPAVMTNKWPEFVTRDLTDSDEDYDEMLRRWQVYDREMKVLIAKGGVHQDEDWWWVDDATGELIGPDPEVERPRTEAEMATARPFAEVFPELAEQIRRSRGRPTVADPKQQVTLRLDAEVLTRLRASGKGWQSRVNDALRKVVGL